MLIALKLDKNLLKCQKNQCIYFQTIDSFEDRLKTDQVLLNYWEHLVQNNVIVVANLRKQDNSPTLSSITLKTLS